MGMLRQYKSKNNNHQFKKIIFSIVVQGNNLLPHSSGGIEKEKGISQLLVFSFSIFNQKRKDAQ